MPLWTPMSCSLGCAGAVLLGSVLVASLVRGLETIAGQVAGQVATQIHERLAEASITSRSGIDVVVLSNGPRDWHFEPFFSDPGSDERGVLYLSREAQLLLASNARDRDPMGEPAGEASTLRYEWDPDAVAGAYIGEQARGHEYENGIRLDEARVDGLPLSQAEGLGPGEFGPRPSRNQRRIRGIRGEDGALVHTLHIWQDDSAWFRGGPNGKIRGSDGLRYAVVVDPRAPVLRLHAAKGAEFYTTPLRPYHVATLHPQTSYVDPDVELEAFVLAKGDSDPGVEYRIGRDGEWQAWPGRSQVSQLLGKKGEYVLQLREKGASALRSRLLVVAPEHAGLAERRESSALLFDAQHLDRLRKELRLDGRMRDEYQRLRDLEHYRRGEDADLSERSGFRETSRYAYQALRHALIAYVEGGGRNVGQRARREAELAVRRLLVIGSVDPLGIENPLWWPNPSLERVTLGFEQGRILWAAMAYDLLLQLPFVVEPGGLMSPIQERKIRDGMASYARLFLQFRDNTQHKPGEGDVHWAAAMEVALLHLAAAMPSYASAAFGAARQEPGHFAPFPGQRISWWDFALRDEPEAPGWPDIVAGARLPLIYDQEGQWRGPRRYEGLLRPFAISAAIVLQRAGQAEARPGLFRYVQRVRDAGFWMATWPGFEFGKKPSFRAEQLRGARLVDPALLLRVDPAIFSR
jgi:hypothetical protein